MVSTDVETRKSCAAIFQAGRQRFNLKADEPMHRHTSFRVGGNADLYAEPENLERFKELLQLVAEKGLPLTIIGGGTNLLVMDSGIRGVVLSLAGIEEKIDLVPAGKDQVRLTAPAGMALSRAARTAVNQGLEGFEVAAGIPGSVGGAVAMNAGTSSGAVSDILESVQVVGPNSTVQQVERGEIAFAHRTARFPREKRDGHGPIIVSASFVLEKGERESIQSRWKTLIDQRRKTQPCFRPTAGCFFKNPPGERTAGQLIDQAGLKGTRINDAMVSERHANFILNMGEAMAEDILQLKKTIEEKVFALFSIKLETEVKIVS
ncbi:MAG: UDP-N-acetylmuramate dehydrogenase [Desulfobacteraceae bacterium]